MALPTPTASAPIILTPGASLPALSGAQLVNQSPPPQPSQPKTYATDLPKGYPGVKVLLMGGAGTGKTYQASGLADLPRATHKDLIRLGVTAAPTLKCRWLMLENSQDTIGRYFADRGKRVPDNIGYQEIPIVTKSFADMGKMAKDLGVMTYKMISEWSDPVRAKHDGMMRMYGYLNKFEDMRTGANLGSVEEWGNDTVLIIDGLSGINRAVQGLIVGSRPTLSQGEWNVGQNLINEFLDKLMTLRCHVIILAHIEREPDEINNTTIITVSTLGKKLAPKIPAKFGDVVISGRKSDKFIWTTMGLQADTKVRNLPLGAELTPGFAPLIESWAASGLTGISTTELA